MSLPVGKIVFGRDREPQRRNDMSPKRKTPEHKIIARARRIVDRRIYFEKHPDKANSKHAQNVSPEWRRQRMRVIVRDDFKCKFCGFLADIDDDLLTVRRKLYDKGDQRLMVDIPSDEFETVCHKCAKAERRPKSELETTERLDEKIVEEKETVI